MCLTKGLFSVDHVDMHRNFFSFRGPGDRYDRYAPMSELHETRDAAAAYANQKRERRIAALQKQIERLSALEF